MTLTAFGVALCASLHLAAPDCDPPHVLMEGHFAGWRSCYPADDFPCPHDNNFRNCELFAIQSAADGGAKEYLCREVRS